MSSRCLRRLVPFNILWQCGHSKRPSFSATEKELVMWRGLRLVYWHATTRLRLLGCGEQGDTTFATRQLTLSSSLLFCGTHTYDFVDYWACGILCCRRSSGKR